MDEIDETDESQFLAIRPDPRQNDPDPGGRLFLDRMLIQTGILAEILKGEKQVIDLLGAPGPRSDSEWADDEQLRLAVLASILGQVGTLATLADDEFKRCETAVQQGAPEFRLRRPRSWTD